MTHSTRAIAALGRALPGVRVQFRIFRRRLNSSGRKRRRNNEREVIEMRKALLAGVMLLGLHGVGCAAGAGTCRVRNGITALGH